MNLEISEIPRISMTNKIKTGGKDSKLGEIKQKHRFKAITSLT